MLEQTERQLYKIIKLNVVGGSLIMWSFKLFKQAAFAVVSVSLICSTAPLSAQSDSGSSASLEEIVVTARKREESLQDTPLAVSAFNARELEQRNIISVNEVSQYIPNVQFDNVAQEAGGGSSSQIFIRGIGQTDYVLTVEPGVAMYLDGVYISKSMGSLIDNIDLEQVEVMRGPQGTLFGRNTIGGAISVTSKRPTEEFEATAEVTGGNYNRIDGKISLSGPVSDRMRLRLTAASQNRDGHVKRLVDGGRQGSKQAIFGRLVAEVDITEDFLATASFDITETNEEAAGRVLLLANEAGPNGFLNFLYNAFDAPACNPALGDPARFSNPDCYNSQWQTELDELKNYSQGPNQSDVSIYGLNLTLDWDIGSFNIKSITAYRNTQVDLGQDLAPNGGGYIDWVDQDIGMETVTQELQLSGTAFNERLSYLAGFFWMNETGSQDFSVHFSPVRFTSGGSIDNTSTAGFAQGTFKITDELALTFGGRFTHDKIRFRPEQPIDEVYGNSGQFLSSILTLPTDPPLELLAIGTPILPRVWAQGSENNFSPAVTLSYDFNDDFMGYFTYSQGFKAGGFTMRAFPPVIPGVTTPITEPNELIPAFGPEEVEMFEIGIKSELFERRMRLNLAGFVTNYDDLQILGTAGRLGVPVIENAGDARLWGIEVESELIVNDWLRLNGSLGWLDHKYLSVSPNTTGITKDLDLANAPEWNASLGTSADLMDNEQGHAYLRVDWSHKGSQFKEPKNELLLRQGSYNILNMSLTWESVDRHWLATVGGTNLLDEIYIVSGIDQEGTGITAASPSRPLEWYVKLKYTF